MQRSLTIGSRSSPLALRQARIVQKQLAMAEAVPAERVDVAFPIRVFKTTGDRITDRTLIEAGGKGLFTKELEEALFRGDIDLAVHSMKDVPTYMPRGLEIAAVLKREDPREAFISYEAPRLMELKEGAVLGTSSLRRQAQALAVRPDLRVIPLRGNVGTRLTKLRRGEADATFLACAGLKRLDQEDAITSVIDDGIMLPAPAQGAVGIEIRTGDSEARDRILRLHCERTETRLAAERGFLAALDGDCRTPIAALAIWQHNEFWFRGETYSPDGKQVWKRESRTELGNEPLEEAFYIGHQFGRSVRGEAGDAIRMMPS